MIVYSLVSLSFFKKNLFKFKSILEAFIWGSGHQGQIPLQGRAREKILNNKCRHSLLHQSQTCTSVPVVTSYR